MTVIAKANWHNGRRGYCDWVSIGKRQIYPKTLVDMWNQVPEEIRKAIQEKVESDF